MDNKIKLITNQKNWMEYTAIKQLETVSKLKGAIDVVGLPDLHAGKTPVGFALKTENVIYPYLIGNDVGCGMTLFYTGIEKKQYKQQMWVKKLNHIPTLEEIETMEFEEQSPIFDLGTLGGGNHFAEFQCVDTILDEEWAKNKLILDDSVFLLVHSGSRGYGHQIASEFFHEKGLDINSEKGKMYLYLHNNGLLWAMRNRLAVADKLLRQLGFLKFPKPIIECCHNFVEKEDDFVIHRKGAVSSKQDFIVIPGSRGSLTYIVKPGKNAADSLYSLSHGAGRKWARSLCQSRVKEKYTNTSIRETALKSSVVCHDTKLLYEEAPEAYKNIKYVIDSLLEFQLIDVVATLKPLITFKG